jgi:ribonucleoside-triphosphate reductase (thioredoxin)
MTGYTDTRQLLSDAKFYSDYSRLKDDGSGYESWDEAVERVMNMHRFYYKDKLVNESLADLINEVEQAYKNKIVLGAQRALQFGGEQLLKHQLKLYNCTSTYADRPEFFGEYFYVLLCGAGGGFSVQKHHVGKLPKVIQRTKSPKLHQVEDSIEGWATALDVLLSSFFEDGGKHPEYKGRKVYFELSQIRPKGSLISGGFKAPGPEPLRRALDRIEYLLTGLTIKSKNSVTLRPIHAYDICMFTSDAVLSGGVRRAASICLFSFDDKEMMMAKTGNWFEENPQRARSNNSAVIKRDEITKEQFSEFFSSIKQFGEPGFFFVDDYDITTNPCVEIGMYPQIREQSGWQGCNLTEINGNECFTEERFYNACRAAAILGTLQAGYTDFKFLSPITKEIFEREALLGVSITGWMNNPKVLFNEEVLKKGAQIVKETNKLVAKLIGINPAARTTCVKPSGNASVLLKTASGIHAEHSNMYIRNIQLNKELETVKIIKKLNPNMVEESIWSEGKTDYVVSFPIIPRKGSILKQDILGVKHLELVKKAQQYWVNEGTNVELCVKPYIRHNVSNTIIVDDWNAVEEYIFENRNYFAGISLLPATGDKDYYQAPNTEVLTPEQIIKKYGSGGVLASGLIVEALGLFDNLWKACSTAHTGLDDYIGENHLGSQRADWIRKFNKFADNYFKGDKKQCEYCLKDVYLLHKWHKIQHTLSDINWVEELRGSIRLLDVDTIGAAACAGGACEI